MCHQTVRPTTTGPNPASPEAPAAQTQRDTEERDPAAAEEDQNQDTSTETERDAPTPDPAKEESCRDGHCEREDKVQAGEPEGEAVQGLRFTSSGDFVGFVRPATSCSSVGVSGSGSLPPNKQEDDSPLTPHDKSESTNEGQSDFNRAKSETTACPVVPQNGEGEHDDGTPESCLKSNNAESNPEASNTSHTSVNSCNENSECSNGSQTHKSSCTERLRLSPHRPPDCPLPPPPAAQTQTTETDCPASVP